MHWKLITLPSKWLRAGKIIFELFSGGGGLQENHVIAPGGYYIKQFLRNHFWDDVIDPLGRVKIFETNFLERLSSVTYVVSGMGGGRVQGGGGVLWCAPGAGLWEQELGFCNSIVRERERERGREGERDRESTLTEGSTASTRPLRALIGTEESSYGPGALTGEFGELFSGALSSNSPGAVT